MARERNNIQAGLFVLIGAAMALAVIFTLADFDRLFTRQHTARVYYGLDDGLRGLRVGSEVTLGGVNIGSVSLIEDAFESTADAEQRVVGQIVEFTYPDRYNLYQNAVIELVVPPLGTGTKLNIRSVGYGDLHDPARPPIAGALAGSELTENFVRDLGIHDQQRQQLRNIIANVEAMSASLREDVPDITASVKRVLADAEPLAADARQAVADIKQSLAQVGELVADARQRSGDWFDRIDRITASTDATLARIETLLRDKDPDLRAVVDHVRELTQTLKDEAAPRLTETLENARRISAEAHSLLVGQRPVIERAIANLQLTAAQLKLTAIEVRRSPWRLLYRPSDKELQYDNLYDAARSFALAAGTLEATATSLQAVVQREQVDADQARRMLEYLEALFTRFQDAEQQFWTHLEGKPPAP